MQSPILPSRAALAKRIALQFSYGQNLIHLVGGSGLGKSYLLEHFVTDHYESFHKAYIQVTAQSRDEQLQTQLLEHSFASPLIDLDLPLRENFFRLLKEQGERPLLWVFDNAKQLSEEFIAELHYLAKTAPGTLYILCASSQGGLLSGAIDIHLEPLSEQESERLLGYFYAQLPRREDPIFAEFLRQCGGNPALLLQWQSEQQMPAQTAKTSLWWRLGPALLVLLILVISLGYRYWPDATQDSLQPVELLADSQVSPQVVAAAPLQSSASMNTAKPEHVAVQLDDTSSDKDGASYNDAAAVLLALESSEPRIPSLDDKAAEMDTEPKAAMAEQPFDHQWYLNQDEKLWVWQLTIMSQPQQIAAYIHRYGLAGEVHHYYRADKGWHVVTWAQAVAKDELTPQLAVIRAKIEAAQPYAKQIAQIKAEINSQQAPELR
ncbi:AAA family ATPase [Pseudoalteromonas sp. T1lg48]|uniref:AAA family ATPase n=1 Tax=Pseudoalteromonas sp. T1lg48 TaxID=2077100 RepID=UPI000CF6AD1B|nr:AAA family ATPase [Pseudoalteromonas sp. T1lg48]